MSSVLITGLTGFVGSHLADFLLEKTDFHIYGLCRTRSPLDNIAHLVGRINSKDRIELIYGDLRDCQSIDRAVKIAKPDYVFHLAAQSYPDYSFIAPLDTFDTNINGTQRLLESIRQHVPEAWVHICSSSEVYGKVLDSKYLPIKESCPFQAASPYSISKIGTDMLGQYYANAHKMNIMITRMFTHTGPRRGDVYAESSFAKQIAMIERGFTREIYEDTLSYVVKVGNLESIRTIADVRDAVRAYYTMLVEHPKRGAIYNIGGTYTCKIGTVLNYLINQANTLYDIGYQVDPDRLRPIDADLQIPDCTLFKNDTGWRPEISFEQTMTDLLKYWRGRINDHGNSFLVR